QRLFLRLMMKAAWVRKDRALTALLSIAVVATMATVGLTIYSDLERKFSREFRSFGANVIMTFPNGIVSPDDLARIKTTAGNKAEAVPVGYAVAQGPGGSPVVVGGTELAAFKALNSWWSLDPVKDSVGVSLIGFRAAAVLSPHGEPFQLAYNGKTVLIHPEAIFHSGSEEDSRIYLNLEQFFVLTGIRSNTIELRIVGTPTEIEQQVRKLAASLPEVEIRPVRQITAAQTAVLGKTRAIVLAASAVVVVLIVVCMVATLTGSVLERRKDFAVMKALGASNRTVNLLFAGDAAILSALWA